MKGLTIEQKARLYDETIEKLREFYRDYDTISCLIDVKEELANLFPELKESEDVMWRNWLIGHLVGYINQTNDKYAKVCKEAITWLKKQKDVSSVERVFRPIVGCDITCAATQAIKQRQLGYKIVLAFNGAYIPIEEKTADDIVNEYYSWLEKQNKTLDPDKVIEWLENQACQGWIEDVEVEKFVDKFKKDFGL